MLKEIRSKKFANGVVYALETEDGFPIEVTDTYLPFYTKDAIGRNRNDLVNSSVGDRTERWMIGVSVMSGCPIGCKFCATGKLKRWRNLTSEEMIEQIDFILSKNPDYNPMNSKEFKINYTRMGEPFLNIDEVRHTIELIDTIMPKTHHYISTVGIKGSNFSWITGNKTLQFSVHSMDEQRRNALIPLGTKMSLEEMGQVRTMSDLKTTVNLSLVSEEDFDIKLLQKYFKPTEFFIKLSPINVNDISEKNLLGKGVISSENYL